MRLIAALLLTASLLVALLGCVESPTENDVDMCKLYCEKIWICNTGDMGAFTVADCQADCEAMSEPENNLIPDQSLLNCANEVSCEEFAACVAPSADGDA